MGAFVVDFSKYISSRVRVLFIFASVIFEMILGWVDKLKDTFVRKLFWGRGDFLKSSMQFLSVILVLVILLTYFYRAPTIQSVNAEDLEYIDVPETDLLVMNATVNTAVPKDRERRAVEEYIVKTGDTLSTIAEDWGVTVETVKWANDLSSDLVRPGQKLDIPPSDGVLVTVKSGDTLSGLAEKYSANEQAIADFNWLDYPFILKEGTQLFIPEGRMPSPTPVVAKRSTPSSYVSGRGVPSVNVGAADPNVGKFLGWPVAGGRGRISQYYKGYYHRGIDIADKSLPNIVAPASGTVIFAGCYGSCPPLGSTYGGSNYAWSIQIDHGNGYTTWYAHLKNIYVRSGQSVSKGQAIGQMGSTGRSTGPHLHFEVRKGSAYGTQVNPLYYVNW
jgi:murein DD-endopeptidase MepM/ murein hydrolase activator NlpD